MFPLFDKDCNLVGWIKPNSNIWDINMNWVAFISNGHVWSSKTNNWLGESKNLLCLDIYGKPIAWNPNEKILGTIKPIKPIRPIRPIRPIKPIKPIRPIKPIKPITPVGGWSSLSFLEWTEQ